MLSGTEIFRETHKKVKTYFVKDAPFYAGQKFPLAEGVVQKDASKLEDRDSTTVYFYARKENAGK